MFKWEKLEFFQISLQSRFNGLAEMGKVLDQITNKAAEINAAKPDAFYYQIGTNSDMKSIDIECSMEMAQALKASGLGIIKDVIKVKPENSRIAPKIPK